MKNIANIISFLRILLLPIPYIVYIYGSLYLQYLCIIIFIFLGMTDFIDGYFARRYGITKIGKILDPIADKIFVNSILLILLLTNIINYWTIFFIILRELFISIARSSLVIRKSQIKVSNFAKLKTIVQMGGMGTIVLVSILSEKGFLLILSVIIIFFIFMIIIALFKNNIFSYWLIPITCIFLVLIILKLVLTIHLFIYFQEYIIILITLFSGLDYVFKKYNLYMKNNLYYHEYIRILWIIVNLIFLLPLGRIHSYLSILISIKILFDFSLSCLDNVFINNKIYLLNQIFIISIITNIFIYLYIIISII